MSFLSTRVIAVKIMHSQLLYNVSRMCVSVYTLYTRKKERKGDERERWKSLGPFPDGRSICWARRPSQVKEERTERGVALRLGHAIYYVLGTYARIYVLL